MSGQANYDIQKIKPVIRLCNNEETTESRLIALAWWMRERYGSTMIQALKTVLPVQEKTRKKKQQSLSAELPEKEEKRPLSDPQRQAVEQILQEWEQESPRPVLLHGVTGSGKTSVVNMTLGGVHEPGQAAII